MDAAARWDAKYANGPGSTTVSPFLEWAAPLLPAEGTAIDVAGGSGRNALWLAARGLQTTLLDASSVALAHAGEAAAVAALDLTLMRHDLETAGWPAGSWDVVLIHLFLDWDVMAGVADHLSPDGVFVFMQPTEVNLERHPSPSRRFLLGTGQLATWVAQQPLEVLHLSEQWQEATGRHEGRLVARRR